MATHTKARKSKPLDSAAIAREIERLLTVGGRMPGNNCPLTLSASGNSAVDCWLADSDGDLLDFIRVRIDRGSVAEQLTQEFRRIADIYNNLAATVEANERKEVTHAS